MRIILVLFCFSLIPVFGAGVTITSNGVFGAGNLGTAAYSNWVDIAQNATNAAMAATNALATSMSSTMAGQLIQTNFISGQLYSNNYGRILHVQAYALLTGAAVSGVVEMDLKVDQAGGNSFTIVSPAKITTLLTSLVAPDQRSVHGWVTNGGVFCFTNTSSGIGNSATLISGTGYIRVE